MFCRCLTSTLTGPGVLPGPASGGLSGPASGGLSGATSGGLSGATSGGLPRIWPDVRVCCN